MKRSASLLLALFLVLTWAVCAYAWEFKMSGSYELDFNYISRVGPGDLFGNAETAAANSGSTSIGLSGPVNGILVPEGLSSRGSDGSWTEEYLTLYPTIIVSPALTLNSIIGFQGALNGPYVGGVNWTNPIHRWGGYISTSRSESIYDPVAVPFLRAAWATAQIPWGRLEFGRRPFGFGLGWAGFHKDDLADTALTLTVPYGPLSMISGLILHDSGEQTDPGDSRNANLTPRTVVSSLDRMESRLQNWYAGLIYANGPLDTGFLFRMIKYNRIHALPGGGNTLRDDQTASFAVPFLLSTSSNNNASVIGDVTLYTIPIYLKYYNGRFFFNAEYAFQRLRVVRDGGRLISGSPRAWFVEGGVNCGPTKLTVAGFYRSGHDRQGGLLNVAAATGSSAAVPTNDSWSQYLGGASSPLEPYNWLMGWHGTGNNSYDASGRPIYTDFKGLAFRGDYAIASNLNFFASWLIGRRASNTGSWWNQYNGGVGPVTVAGNNVADTNIGWEFDVGTSWKLLEGLTWETRFAYWKPGQWWKQAYQDLSASGTTGTTNMPANGDRNIDPIIGFKTSLRIDF